MRRRTFLCALAFTAAICVGTPASACALNPIVRIGPPPTAQELAAERERERGDFIRQRREVGARELAAGTDPAAGLAPLLVPNIRPVPIQYSDCGPMNEIDSGAGAETGAGLLAGTYLAGSELASRLAYYQGETPGRACNAEFRDNFAAYLRRRLDARQLRGAYLFLRSRWAGPGTPLSRLVYFQNQGRRPPVQWDWDGESIERWMRRADEGRALKRVLDDFWREYGPLLGDAARVCPVAAGRDGEIRATILAWFEEHFPYAVRRARARRP
jgi:hypothetical protein